MAKAKKEEVVTDVPKNKKERLRKLEDKITEVKKKRAESKGTAAPHMITQHEEPWPEWVLGAKPESVPITPVVQRPPVEKRDRTLSLLSWSGKSGMLLIKHKYPDNTVVSDVYSLTRESPGVFRFQKIECSDVGVLINYPYRVIRIKDEISCNCKGYESRRQCRHTAAILKLLAEKAI